MGSGFGAGGRVWAKIGDQEAEVRGVERAEYPGVEWVRVAWPGGVSAAWVTLRAGVGEKASNQTNIEVR